jgi:hypothetical protein
MGGSFWKFGCRQFFCDGLHRAEARWPPENNTYTLRQKIFPRDAKSAQGRFFQANAAPFLSPLPCAKVPLHKLTLLHEKQLKVPICSSKTHLKQHKKRSFQCGESRVHTLRIIILSGGRSPESKDLLSFAPLRVSLLQSAT